VISISEEKLVMAGLDPAIFAASMAPGMPGSSPGMTGYFGKSPKY
jgi:hypothetical protein